MVYAMSLVFTIVLLTLNSDKTRPLSFVLRGFHSGSNDQGTTLSNITCTTCESTKWYSVSYDTASVIIQYITLSDT